MSREPAFIQHVVEESIIINDQIDGAFLKRVYQASLEKLPAQTRKVIELIFDDQLTYPRVATLLNISVNTVKGLRKYGLRKIKDSTNKREIRDIRNEIS